MRLAKKLKKEKVNVDIVSFGENVKHCFSVSLHNLNFCQQVENQTRLQEFIEALNGKDGNLSV